jgi:hypothetical protein
VNNNEYLKLFNEFTDTLRKQGNYDEITKYELQYLINEKPNLKFKNHVKKLLQGHNQQIIDQASQRGVACFTQNFDSILMWSHYADGHRGLCLEFDTNYVPFRERKYLHQIIYRNSYPLLSPFDLIQSPDKLIYPLITKSKKWKYEEEWRIILKVGNSEIYYDPRALTGIYFGCAMPDNQKRLIAALPAKSAARLCYMKRSSTKFKLERIPYPG